MSRIYVAHDARGERQLDEQALPLSIGGDAAGDIVMPGVSAERLVAHIALSDGHAYIQTADNNLPLFHNHEHLSGSQWLKSGDEVQLGDAVMRWTVQGDVVTIRTETGSLSAPDTPPADSPPATRLIPPQRAIPDAVKPTPPRGSPRKLRWSVFAVFVLLLLASAFVLLSTPIVVDVTPEPERQSLHGFPPPLIIGNRRLAVPGRYTVRASRDGYRDLQAVIDVERGGLQTFTLALEDLPGRVRFQLQPVADYRVFVDDVLIPTIDGVTGIAGGSHQLRIETDRYLPVTAQVDITGHGEAQQFAYELQPAWADVSISSEPAGATVHIDNVMQGVTPLTIEIMAGEHHIEVSLDNYKTVSMQQVITAGSDVQLDTIVLVPADGQLSVSSDHQCGGYLLWHDTGNTDVEFCGAAQCAPDQARLPADRQTCTTDTK